MITDHEIRKAIMSHPARVKYLLLTRYAVETVKLVVKMGSINAQQLSKIRVLTIQNSSRQLCTLYNKGYLTRDEVVSKSGGIEYLYKSAI